MYNFYQSDIWRKVNKDVYKKPVFNIDFLWKKYFWTEKQSKKFWISLKWYQITWIELWEWWDGRINDVKDYVENLARDFKTWFWDIFFQLWFIDILQKFHPKKIRDEEFVNWLISQRKEKEKIIKEKLKLVPSFRENMPMATIIYDLTKSEKELWDDMSKSSRSHINKAQNRWLQFSLAKEGDWEKFYDIWYQTSHDKWFNIIDKQTFWSLKEFMLWNNWWDLFLVKKDWIIISWSVCFFADGNIIYMYWATNRDFGNVWWHHFLKYEMFKWGSVNWFKSADLLWVAPTWYANHHLDWVTNFKQSLWWTKIEFLWNFDYILNNKLYETFRFIKRLKK